MESINKRQIKFLLASAAIILLSFPAAVYVLDKADLPFSVYTHNESIIVKKVSDNVPGLQINDRIVSIDGIYITSREGIEILMDSRDIGKEINLNIQRGGENFDLAVKSVPFYSATSVAFQLFTSLIFIVLGLFVLIKCPANRAAELFYVSMLGAAAIMIMTWGKYSLTFDLSHITRIIFQGAYLFTPVVFVYLSLAFPVDKLYKFKKHLRVFSLFSLILFIPCTLTFYNAAVNQNASNINLYINVYNLSRYFLAASVIISISVFIINYLSSEDPVERKKLKWLITGFIVGPLAFIMLWVLPQAFSDYALIPEELVYFLMLSVPVCFTISIVKYHLLDIDFIINRSIIYSILVAGIILTYFAIVLGITWFFKSADISVISALSAVFVAFLFNPLKNRVRSFVNKKFFRVQYNYRKAINMFSSQLKEINDALSLADAVISGILKLIPAEKIALIDTSDSGKPVILSENNFNESDFRFLTENILVKYTLLENIIVPDAVEPGIDLFQQEPLLREIGIPLVMPSLLFSGRIYLVLAMGSKKSAKRYSAEDLDLLSNVLNTASSVIARIKLQEDLIIKNLEAVKLKEINRQKSLFVSTVSHELKTPLTSIKMYSELIQGKQGFDKEKINNFAEYIEGESERLTRLINNVLNFSSIEKGVKIYSKEPVELNQILKKVLSIMNYQAKVQKFTIHDFLEEKEMTIYADADALIEVFINLISNGIKYSPGKKFMNIYSGEEGENYTVTFQDFGIGISEEDQKNLFAPFYRSTDALKLKIPGTGLGLSIIRHTADAHNIKIEIKSKVSEGTTIKLIIPKFQREFYEENTVD